MYNIYFTCILNLEYIKNVIQIDVVCMDGIAVQYWSIAGIGMY